MSNDLLMGKPMLIISNKSDLPGALDSLDVCDYFEVRPSQARPVAPLINVSALQIEYLANLFRTPCLVEGVGRHDEALDAQAVRNACAWLVKTICKHHKSIHNKIRFLRVVTQNESLSSNEEIPRRNRRPATGKRKVSVKSFFTIFMYRCGYFGSSHWSWHVIRPCSSSLLSYSGALSPKLVDLNIFSLLVRRRRFASHRTAPRPPPTPK